MLRAFHQGEIHLVDFNLERVETVARNLRSIGAEYRISKKALDDFLAS